MPEPKAQHTGETVHVNIRNIAVGGAGVGEVTAQADGGTDLLGITAFVPYSAIGEQVRARVTQRKERYLTADLVMVESPAPERVEPRCPYFTICGGCELQHISYDGQLKAKKEMIRGALRVGGHLSHVVESVRDVAGGPPYGYRSRVTLHVDPTGKVGFYRPNSRSVVEIHQCPISSSAISELLPAAQEYARKTAGTVNAIILEADQSGVVAVIKCAFQLNKTALDDLILNTKPYFESAAFVSGERELGGYGRKVLNIPANISGSLAFKVPAGSFSQVNREINHKLVSYTVNACQPLNGKVIYDLYAGAGNFSLMLAKGGASVTAVECDPRLAAFGRENAQRWGLEKRLAFIESSVESFLRKGPKLRPPEVLVADPPRSGLGKAIADLPKCSKLILISCHLPSCVRDLRNLAAEGWKIEEIQPFDMFAQTSYTEIVSVMTR